ncbi:MAG: DUF805 domain-containing protein [Hyphomicrobiaceae bacterium]
MSFMDSIKTCFSKYFDFSGRARRSEFWWFMLLYLIVSIIPIVQIAVLGMIIPIIAVTARRLHDTDRSGWWQLAPLVPMAIGGGILAAGLSTGDGTSALTIVGGIVALLGFVVGILLIVWYASDSQPGPNRFGPSPK